MDRWERANLWRGRDAVAATNPSFSSSLLDAIYRSIDEGGGVDNDSSLCAMKRPQSPRRKPHATATTSIRGNEKVVLRQLIMGCHDGRDDEHRLCKPRQQQHRLQQRQRRDPYVLTSASTSSESSYGGFSSSSDADSAAARTLPFQPKLVRVAPPPPAAAAKQGSRSRASAMYGELKKPKTPSSPAARLAGFLNALFASAGHPKKAKISIPSSAGATTPRPPPATDAGRDGSTCSSASSYSRSCLSNPSSSGRKLTAGGERRSVRFYPVGIIVGEDSRPCGQTCIYDGYGYGYGGRDRPVAAAKENKKKHAARDLIGRKGGMSFEEGYDDGASSDSSSDLFELESLTGAVSGGGGGGGGRYRDELPVYETTRLDANRAIVRGLML